MTPVTAKVTFMQAGEGSERPQVGVEVWPVEQLLRDERISIPDYQRPYKWEIRNVAQLIDDVQEFVEHGTYRLGSIILHQDEHGKLNIVDGQQRFVTLVLIAAALADAGSQAIDRKWLQSRTVAEFGLEVSKRHLLENNHYIREVVGAWVGTERDRFAEFLLSSCEIVVLTLTEIDEAFQMFDSQNTRGKALYPTDLLKAFHIREMKSDLVTEDKKRRMVALWEDIKPAEVSALFTDYLFKIRRWGSGRAVPDAGMSTADIDMFKGVRQGDPDNAQNHWARPLLYAKNFTEDFRQENAALVRFGVMLPLEFPYQIDQPIINGETFFGYVAHYHQLATAYGLFGHSAKKNIPQEIAILDRHRNDTRYGLVRNLFDCLLLTYIDRFGERELDPAARLFARHAMSFRAEHYAVKRSMVNNFSLGRDGEDNLFRDLRDATRPRDFLRRSVPMPSKKTAVRLFSEFDTIVSELWEVKEPVENIQ